MSSDAIALPVIIEGGLRRYLQEIRKFPILTAEEEYLLARSWREQADTEAAHRLVTSHLRLVAKIAMGYRGYGFPIGDLISEGNVGMMQAVKRFDPERGFRLATYAIWWIRASIQEYVLHSWSLVKMGTTAAQKKLFFNLRKLKAQLRIINEGDMTPEQVATIADKLNLETREVIEMDRRLSWGDYSLNAKIGNQEDSEGEWIDLLADNAPNQEIVLGDAQELAQRQLLLRQAMAVLNDRERSILIERRLVDKPKTLDQLSGRYKVSCERIRQIEARAFEKLRRAIRKSSEIATQKARKSVQVQESSSVSE